MVGTDGKPDFQVGNDPINWLAQNGIKLLGITILVIAVIALIVWKYYKRKTSRK